MPRRENRSRTVRQGKETRPRILIVCGGARTEVDYIQGMRDALPVRTVDINVRVRSKSPRHVVERAIELAASSDFDDAWCVFDVDEFSTEDAVLLAADRDVQLAISAPCFELWLLLHFEERTAYLYDYRAAARCLRRHVADYDKTRLRFADYQAGVTDAIERARKLGDEGNPSSGMWRLAMRIRSEEEQ